MTILEDLLKEVLEAQKQTLETLNRIEQRLASRQQHKSFLERLGHVKKVESE